MSVNEVLIIDDEDVAVLEPLVSAFDAGGIRVDTATTWDNGVEEFLLGGHALVIADWNLPGSRNGLALLARLKRLRPGARLILISGYLDESQRAEIEALPFVDLALAKGDGLTERLFQEAQATLAQVGQPNDWAGLAAGYRAAVATDLATVEALETSLRGGTA